MLSVIAIVFMSSLNLSIDEVDLINDPNPYTPITCSTFHTNAELFAINSGGVMAVKKTSAGQMIKKIHCYKVIVLPLTAQCIKAGHHAGDCKKRARVWWKTYRTK
jgi:hypothetical protein